MTRGIYTTCTCFWYRHMPVFSAQIMPRITNIGGTMELVETWHDMKTQTLGLQRRGDSYPLGVCFILTLAQSHLYPSLLIVETNLLLMLHQMRNILNPRPDIESKSKIAWRFDWACQFGIFNTLLCWRMMFSLAYICVNQLVPHVSTMYMSRGM